MRRAALAILLALSLSPVHAGPASAESVERLLVAMGQEEALEAALARTEQAMRQAMRQAAGNRALSDDQRRLAGQLPDRLVAALREEMGWRAMRPMYVKVYQETFEQQEVDGLVAFYASPAGQAFTRKMPGALQKSTGVAQQRLQARMKQVVEEALREAKIAN
jgi:hypothetical protein